MAGLSRNPHRSRRGQNPNSVLVMFLVFFILVSIGLGVWLYTEFGNREQAKDDVKEAKLETEAVKKSMNFYRLMALEAMVAQGHKKLLTNADQTFYDVTRQSALQPGGPFDGEAGFDGFKKLLESYKKDLDGYNEQAKRYAKTYPELANDANVVRDTFATEYSKKTKDLADAANSQAKDKQAYDQGLAATKNDIAQFRKNILITSADFSAKTRKLIDENNKKFDVDLQMLKTKHAEELRQRKVQFDVAQALIIKLKNDLTLALGKAGQPNQGPSTIHRVPHALLLDVSAGKALWDDPVGKITKIDIKNREVYISVGSKAGVKTGTTFNIFGSGSKNTAAGGLKGTIEVVRVLDAVTSHARLTSLYDGSGQEISLFDPGKTRLMRERDNPIEKGDLIFNLALGTHVALAGNIHWQGFRPRGSAAQMRSLEDYIRMLKRQGIIVDAYVDLTTGTMVGKMTSKTKFLIKGEYLVPAGFDNVDKKRLEFLNAGIIAAEHQAIQRGMFIISAQNFAFVIGFRPARDADDLRLSKFLPHVPRAGKIGAGQASRGPVDN